MSPACTCNTVKVAVWAPVRLAPSARATPPLSHWQLKGKVPTALTLKLAEAPAVTDWFCGWATIHGSSTVNTAFELRTEP